MNFFGKVYCRAFQGVMKVVLPMMPYREPVILESMDAVANTLIEKNIDNVMLVTDANIVKLNLLKTLIYRKQWKRFLNSMSMKVEHHILFYLIIGILNM